MGSIIVIGGGHIIAANTFVDKCNECLDMLSRDASQYYSWMLKYELKIRAAEKSGANFKTETIDIGLDTFNSSKTWLASVFIHETIHFWQYKAGHYQAGTPAETEANRYQLAVLRLLKAPAREITHMLAQNGSHADLNGDGVYDRLDYEMRRY